MDNTQMVNGLTWKMRLEKGIGSFWRWLRNDVDWALVFAAVVEVPRWAAAFLAIHEPLIIGVPLAMLLAWSMKSGWEYFFKRGFWGAKLVLLMNMLALAVAVCIITPVIYLMMSAPVDQIDMTTFDLQSAEPVQLFWAFCLSLGTFLPLILVSAVRSGDRLEQEAKGDADIVGNGQAEDSTPVEKVPAKSAARRPKTVTVVSEQALGYNDRPADYSGGAGGNDGTTVDSVLFDPEPVLVMETSAYRNGTSPKPSSEMFEAWTMVNNGYTTKEVGDHFSTTDRTIRNWVKKVREYRGEE